MNKTKNKKSKSTKERGDWDGELDGFEFLMGSKDDLVDCFVRSIGRFDWSVASTRLEKHSWHR